MKFPVMELKDGGIAMQANASELSTRTQRNLRRDGWLGPGLRIIDADGYEYCVDGVRFVRKTNRKLFKGLFAPRLIEVELTTRVVRHLSVDEVREAINAEIAHSPEIWITADQDEVQIAAALRTAKSVPELLGVMMPMLSTTANLSGE